ncbi:MAG: hypothetical protein HY717_12850 [Planctomycetes bacterium]|nr:hypothetical protein [Planctomycetota bacterium]
MSAANEKDSSRQDARFRKHDELLANIKAKLTQLKALLETATSHWGYEDPIYRFYYGSFKVYLLQDQTREVAELLRSLAPAGQKLCSEFEEILASGASGKTFELEHNREWTKHTRPMVEAFLHAKYFLEMAVKYGTELEEAPNLLPSGWAALLCLYGVR